MSFRTIGTLDAVKINEIKMKKKIKIKTNLAFSNLILAFSWDGEVIVTNGKLLKMLMRIKDYVQSKYLCAEHNVHSHTLEKNREVDKWCEGKHLRTNEFGVSASRASKLRN